MKGVYEFVKLAQSFITFDAPFKIGSIKTLFAATHQKQQSIMPHWGVTSTRQKLIAHYWYSQVVSHFALLLTLPILIFLFTSGRIDHGHFLVILFGAGVTFAVMLVVHYLPGYTGNFLPKLDAVVNGHRQEQLAKIVAFQQLKINQLQQEIQRITAGIVIEAEQHFMALEKSKQEVLENADLIDQLNGTITSQKKTISQLQMEIRRLKKAVGQQKVLQQEDLTKCKRAQLDNFALVLIYYVFEKRKTELPELESSIKSAHLLVLLFGRHEKGIYKSLKLIRNCGGNSKKVSGRGRTEIEDSFKEAYRFFRKIGFKEAEQLLRELEMKIIGQ